MIPRRKDSTGILAGNGNPGIVWLPPIHNFSRPKQLRSEALEIILSMLADGFSTLGQRLWLLAHPLPVVGPTYGIVVRAC